MKHKVFRIALIAEAILCILLSALHSVLPPYFPAMASFPFSQLGLGLRTLSLSGSTGNFFAVLLYAAICLLPSVALLPMRRTGTLHWEDGLLVLISAALFPILFLMVNPGLTAVPGSEGVLCSVVWSLAAAWLTLRVLRSLFSSDRHQLALWFSRLLRAAAFYYVFELFGVLLPALLQELSMLQASSDPFSAFVYSDTEIAFTVIRHLVSALPSALLLTVILRAVALMDLARCGDDGVLPAAERLSRLCRTTVSVTVLSVAAADLLQLFLFDRLLHVHISVVLPMMELIFVLGILLLTRYMAENRRLQEDNDLFI